MTFAPKDDNSNISSYEIFSIFFATGILFGSVENTPSTSVYISQLSVLNIFAIATADASDPPLPIVVISPFCEIPWKPGKIATPFSSKYSLIFSTLIFIILEFVCSPSVSIGICQFNQDFAFTSILVKAPDNKADVTCSPEDKRTSISLLLNSSEISLERLINSLVFPAIAETTTIILFPKDRSFLIIFATCCILSLVPTDVPPNFSTFLTI